ncbi:MAG: DUF3524 domain-containing protein [Caldilineae bacterium]|nr:MAG: DUF3524 domain-containing protein [Caldilineae bacterium]
MRVYLLSPYHAGSHRLWAEGYARASHHEVHLLTMAGRFWKWRMQGGALELAEQVEQTCHRYGPPDVLLVTDMVNLPALLALARPRLANTPVLFYAHENQLTYPPPPGEKRDLTYAMINTLSMACADVIAFNSAFHRRSFFAELPNLLKHFPDYNHLHLVRELEAKSVVLPVGLDLTGLDRQRPQARRQGPLHILWNQRWEYDKNPAAFFRALYALEEDGYDFRVSIVGENFRRQPAEFEEARHRLAGRIRHFGFQPDRNAYARVLWQADLVVSTAVHEFFGISILEAIYCECYPLLPARLSYPELLPEPEHDAHLYRDEADLLARLEAAAGDPASIRGTSLRHVAARFDWQRLASRYDALLASLAAGQHR